MKSQSLAAALILSTSLAAQEPPPENCPMCGAMKAPAASPGDRASQIADLDRLVVEMNGSLGEKKIAAMAAIVTRLVEHYKSTAGRKPSPPAAPPAELPKEEPHQH